MDRKRIATLRRRIRLAAIKEAYWMRKAGQEGASDQFMDVCYSCAWRWREREKAAVRELESLGMTVE